MNNETERAASLRYWEQLLLSSESSSIDTDDLLKSIERISKWPDKDLVTQLHTHFDDNMLNELSDSVRNGKMGREELVALVAIRQARL